MKIRPPLCHQCGACGVHGQYRSLWVHNGHFCVGEIRMLCDVRCPGSDQDRWGRARL